MRHGELGEHGRLTYVMSHSPRGSEVRSVFISYRSTHEDVAVHLRNLLLKHRILAFVAAADLRPERDWTRSLDEHLHNSQMVLFVGSKDAFHSAEVWSEIARARELGIPIVRWLLFSPSPADWDEVLASEFGPRILDDRDKTNYAFASPTPTEDEYTRFVGSFAEAFTDHLQLSERVSHLHRGGKRSDEAEEYLVSQFFNALEFLLPDLEATTEDLVAKDGKILPKEYDTTIRLLRVTRRVAHQMNEIASKGGGDSLSAQRARLSDDEIDQVCRAMRNVIQIGERGELHDIELEVPKMAAAVNSARAREFFDSLFDDWWPEYEQGRISEDSIGSLVRTRIALGDKDAEEHVLTMVRNGAAWELDLKALGLWGSAEAIAAIEESLIDADQEWQDFVAVALSQLRERHDPRYMSVAAEETRYFLNRRPQDAQTAVYGRLEMRHSDVLRALRFFEIGELVPTAGTWFKAHPPATLDDITARPRKRQANYAMKYMDLQGEERLLAPKDVFWMTELLLRGRCDTSIVVYGGDVNFPLLALGFDIVSLAVAHDGTVSQALLDKDLTSRRSRQPKPPQPTLACPACRSDESVPLGDGRWSCGSCGHESAWYKVASSGYDQVEITCLTCGTTVAFEPRIGERPEDRCPACGSRFGGSYE